VSLAPPNVMPAILDRPGVETFTREDFERAWQHDVEAPKCVRITPESEIIVRRTSPNDFQDRQIYVWIDEEPLGKIRYGDAISRPIEPGRHTVRVFNTLLSRTVTVDAAPGEQVRLQCGTGLPTAGWLMLMFLHVSYLKVWLARE
jgi:hypothetical protein